MGRLTETCPTGRNSGKTGNAPGNDQSGTWVRVAEWLSGANWGSHFLPRIGTEVVVDFLDGDIDRPIVVGQAYNGADLPPFSAGHEAGANHPGVLSGWMCIDPVKTCSGVNLEGVTRDEHGDGRRNKTLDGQAQERVGD